MPHTDRGITNKGTNVLSKKETYIYICTCFFVSFCFYFFFSCPPENLQARQRISSSMIGFCCLPCSHFFAVWILWSHRYYFDLDQGLDLFIHSHLVAFSTVSKINWTALFRFRPLIPRRLRALTIDRPAKPLTPISTGKQ